MASVPPLPYLSGLGQGPFNPCGLDEKFQLRWKGSVRRALWDFPSQLRELVREGPARILTDHPSTESGMKLELISFLLLFYLN